jgi:heme exporter protein A
MRLRLVALICSLRGIGVSLGGRPVLRDIDLDLGPGQVVGIAGPNGSGKTTLVRTLATLIRIDRGDGAVLGADLSTGEIYEVRRAIGLMGHRPAAIPELTLAENLEHLCILAGTDPSRAHGALEVVGLEGAARTRAGASSHGMLRRLEVARLLLTRPRLLLLDEATHGLDNSAQELMDALIDRTVGDGGGTVMVSHDADRLSSRCDAVLGLAVGRLVAGT